jgi:hypothetical protein
VGIPDDGQAQVAANEVLRMSGPVIVNNPESSSGNNNTAIVAMVVLVVVLILLWWFLLGPGAGSSPDVNITIPTAGPASS